MKMSKQTFSYRKEDLIIIYKKLRIRFSAFIAENRISAYVRLVAHVSFARHGRALAGESPEHAQVVGNV